MDQVAPQFRAIASRRYVIRTEISSLRLQIETLEVEFGELEIAARVLHRLGLVADETGPELPLPPVNHDGEQQRLTVPEMINHVIAYFINAGLPGATGQQVLIELTKRWNVSDPNIVRPTLWRMVKANRLKRHGDIYAPRDEDEPQTNNEAVSSKQSSDVSADVAQFF